MTMIPGAWEPRRLAGAPVTVVVAVETIKVVEVVEEVRRRELPGWLKVAIFAATLFAVMWLTMAVFFEPAI